MQADKHMAISKLQEAHAQIDVLEGNIHVLKVRRCLSYTLG